MLKVPPEEGPACPQGFWLGRRAELPTGDRVGEGKEEQVRRASSHADCSNLCFPDKQTSPRCPGHPRAGHRFRQAHLEEDWSTRGAISGVQTRGTPRSEMSQRNRT